MGVLWQVRRAGLGFMAFMAVTSAAFSQGAGPPFTKDAPSFACFSRRVGGRLIAAWAPPLRRPETDRRFPLSSQALT